MERGAGTRGARMCEWQGQSSGTENTASGMAWNSGDDAMTSSVNVIVCGQHSSPPSSAEAADNMTITFVMRV